MDRPLSVAPRVCRLNLLRTRTGFPSTWEDAFAAFRFRDPDFTPTPRGPEGEVGITPTPLRTD
jgi:hypothetical protein